MSENQAHVEIKVPSERSFGILFAAIFSGLTLWGFYKSGEIYPVLGITAVILWLISFFKPALLKPLNLLWFKFGMLLSAVVSPVVMAIIFFLVVTPMGLVCKILRKDLLRLKLDSNAKSYWIIRDSNVGSMKDQF